MHITLKAGEYIAVQFEQTDGEFQIHFDTPRHPNALVVEETSQALNAAVGVVFREQFGVPTERHVVRLEDEVSLAAVQKIPAPAAAWKQSAPIGFFMDGNNRIHCTAFVHCAVVPNSMRGNSAHITQVSWRVETLSSDDTVTGEYDFYPTLVELEAASGMTAGRKIIA